MRKYTLLLSIFTFILLGFLVFAIKSAKAYDYGCTGAGPYSTITGQLCASSQYSSYTGYQYNSAGDFLNQQFQIGSRGNKIVALQQILANAGFFTGEIDGIYGPQTDGAFLSYLAQYSNNNNNNSYPYSYSNQSFYPYYYNYDQTPVISGINGPQTLNVNQIGTWIIAISGSYSGNLTYTIDWGDRPVYPFGTNNSSTLSPQQNALFTHTYTEAGTYQPRFTVTNSNGQSASTNLSVVVSGSASRQVPVIYSISPTYGPIGTQVTISGTGFGYSGCTTYYCGNGITTNTINFGGAIIPNVYSYNGTNLVFTVPSNLNTCYPGLYCTQVYLPVNPGIYPIFVTNANGVSNSVNFTVSY